MATKKKDSQVPEVEYKQPKKSPVMYLGPTIPKMGLKTNQLYRDGIPDKFNKEPLKRLFAEPMAIHSLKENIKKVGTAASLAYKDVSKYIEME